MEKHQNQDSDQNQHSPITPFTNRIDLSVLQKMVNDIRTEIQKVNRLLRKAKDGFLGITMSLKP